MWTLIPFGWKTDRSWCPLAGEMKTVRLSEEEAFSLREGIREFNEGYYFEAHDTLEEAWHGIRGPHRAFYHGLIQMATGFYHLTGNNLKGAESQLSLGLKKLSPFLPFYLGVEVARLDEQVRKILNHVRAARSGRMSGIETGRLPCIRFREKDS